MGNLPNHGRIDCTLCYNSCSEIEFDLTRRTEGAWRITANPLAWGATEPEVIVLGFSKGPTQAGALANTPHDEIAYKGSRGNVGKILRHVGLLPQATVEELKVAVNRLISDPSGRFHFGSLIRCTVERNDAGTWKGSGGMMLDKFIATSFGKEVAHNCMTRFLKDLPTRTKLIVMFGMGSKLNYVRESFGLFQKIRGGQWKWLNDIAYTDGKVVVVHVEHFASQGNLLPRWLGEGNHPRGNYGVMAQQQVAHAFSRKSSAAEEGGH